MLYPGFLVALEGRLSVFWKQFRITESVRDVVGHVRQLLPMIGITIIAQHLCNRLLNVAVTER